MELASTNTDIAVDSEVFKEMQNIKKQYFLPNQSDEASEAVNSVVEIVNQAEGAVVFNFDTNKELEKNYAIIIAPINQRTTDSKNVVVGVSIGGIPTYELMMESPEGAAWIKEQVTNAILTKLANAVRPNTKTGEIPATRPYTVQDFIVSNRTNGVLVAYRKLAPKYIKVLKDKGIKDLTDSVFRQVLTSTAFAEDIFGKISQKVWINVLNSMIESAKEEDMIPGLLTEWLQTRDSAGMPEVEEIDLVGLEGLFTN
jgi:hypothetical protein